MKKINEFINIKNMVNKDQEEISDIVLTCKSDLKKYLNVRFRKIFIY